MIRLRFVTDFQIVKELLMHVMHQFYKVSAILDRYRYRNPSRQRHLFGLGLLVFFAV